MLNLKGIKRKIDTTGRITIPSIIRDLVDINKGEVGTWFIADNGDLILKFDNENTN